MEMDWFLGWEWERDGGYLRHILTEFEGYAREKWVRFLAAIHRIAFCEDSKTREYVLM